MSDKEFEFGESKLIIKNFDIEKMIEPFSIGIFSKIATGKSFLTKELVYHKRHIDSVIAINETEKSNHFYTDFISENNVYSEYDSSILSNIYEKQFKLNNELLLIMDDCISPKGTWSKDPNITELFFNGRHHRISFMLTMRYPVGIPPEMRSNFDYIFLLAEDTINNRKRLYEHYADMFPSFDIFQQVFSDITENYGVMVIDNRGHSKNITDNVFWYKAKQVPSFKVGPNA